MNKFVIVAVVLFLCINVSTCEPVCYNQACPAGTTNCKKNIRSSPNRRNLEIRINCLDDFNGSLKEYFFQEPSSMNPHTHYESSSFSAAGGIRDDYYVGNNGLEEFLR
ncbi:uncharacterized protein LOC108907943 [Anoplophora glabripennis]|uniref:uncharacterized protein LOC108907943 n=1 Tax=Anoplophora glabripennis TaxID=217634 RepID=UPI0008736255|nr:uncharacterized protein LOC108907943 [Anoplophora glabripennis]